MNLPKINVLIVGANGRLGTLVTKECLQYENINVNVIVRDRSKNQEVIKEVEQRKGKVYEFDFSQPELLTEFTKDIHTIVSCLCGPDTYESQRKLLEYGSKNGVKRFLPSEYSCVEFPQVKEEGENDIIKKVKEFCKELEKSQVKSLHFYNGIFTEWFFDQDPVHYYGTGKEELPFTSYRDTAKYVAAAISDPERSGEVRIIVENLTMEQVEDICQKETGNKLNIVRGNFEEGNQRIKQLIDEKKNMDAFILELVLLWAQGKGPSKSDNTQFPNVKPDFLVTDYFKSKKEKQVMH